MSASDAPKREEIGLVTRADLFIEDHGILTLNLALRFNGSGCGYGGYTLDTYDAAKKCRVGCAFGTEIILRTLAFFGVDRLESAVGKYVVAEFDGYRLAQIARIRRLPVDGGAVLDMRAIAAEYAK